MSAATADAPPAKGKKKLLIIVAAAVLLAGGGGAVLLMKKKPHAEEGEDEAQTSAPAHSPAAKRMPGAVPTFVPLDGFTVNLADRDAERYAQVGITLEIDDAKLAEQIKLYMPAIRNNILMTIADRTATELMDREGKGKLAERIKRETSRALGYEVDDEEDEEAAEEERPRADTKKKKKKKRAAPPLPVKGVHFSNFIIQ